MSDMNVPRVEMRNTMLLPFDPPECEGVRLGYKPWGPGVYVRPFHLEHGFDSLHLIGNADTLTDVRPPKGQGEGTATVHVDSSMRAVIFENYRFHGTWRSILHLGATSANAASPKPLWVEFRNCELSTDDGHVKQGIEGHQAGVRFFRCRVDDVECYEHFAYLRGTVIGPDGYSIHVDASTLTPRECSEVIKSPTRVTWRMGNQGKHGTMDGMWPLRTEGGERATVMVDNSFIHRQHRSSMSGGGIVLQDGDKNLHVRNSVVVVDEGEHCLALDAHTEGVGPDGESLGLIPDGHPGNGWVLAEDATLLARPEPSANLANMMRVMSCSGVGLIRSGVYSIGASKADREPDPFGQRAGQAVLDQVNTPAHLQRARSYASSLGWVTSAPDSPQLEEPQWVGDWHGK